MFSRNTDKPKAQRSGNPFVGTGRGGGWYMGLKGMEEMHSEWDSKSYGRAVRSCMHHFLYIYIYIHTYYSIIDNKYALRRDKRNLSRDANIRAAAAGSSAIATTLDSTL